MTYEELSVYISSTYKYADVSPAERELITVDHFVTQVEGVLYVGSETPIAALSAKEVVAPPVEPTE